MGLMIFHPDRNVQLQEALEKAKHPAPLQEIVVVTGHSLYKKAELIDILHWLKKDEIRPILEVIRELQNPLEIYEIPFEDRYVVLSKINILTRYLMDQLEEYNHSAVGKFQSSGPIEYASEEHLELLKGQLFQNAPLEILFLAAQMQFLWDNEKQLYRENNDRE